MFVAHSRRAAVLWRPLCSTKSGIPYLTSVELSSMNVREMTDLQANVEVEMVIAKDGTNVAAVFG